MACMGIQRKEVGDEVKKQLWLAVPIVFVYFFQNGLRFISVMFVGHLGELALSGAAMATSMTLVTGYNVLLGMASALDTLCGQSFGAEQYHMLGIHMQRAIFILSLVNVPLAIILANIRSILIAMRQDPEISEEAREYALLLIPSLFAYGLLHCLVKFLVTQRNVFPMVLTSGITTLLHIPLCWILVFKSGLGSRGAALAISISYGLNVLWLALYVKFSSSCAKTWTGFSKQALHKNLTFLRLAFPSAIMFCVKQWSFQLMIFLSGLLPNPKLETSVLSICLATIQIVGTITYGLGNTISTRVSNELGARHPQAACLAVRIVLLITITQGVLVGLVMILLRNIWGHVYTSENEVLKYVATMMPMIAISSFLDGMQNVLTGIARGCGWQKIGAYVSLGSFYLVGIPSAILFAFILHMKGKGLWLGIICAQIMQVVFLLIITILTNWEKQATKAVARVYDSTLPADTASQG